MKILLAPNAFKGSLSSPEVCRFLAEGLASVSRELAIESIPLGDGGDGTLEVLVELWGGRIAETIVQDPLGRRILAPVGFDPENRRAAIEMARASGLALLDDSERDPMNASSVGTGELIEYAIEVGVREIYLGIGGSATNDGGAGMGSALGFVHENETGDRVSPRGGNLSEIARISGRPNPLDIEVTVLCDVTNPLCGENGASAVYGPQKGASPDEVQVLDRNLGHLASLWERDLGRTVGAIPGSGAAGGMGGGAMAYLDAKLVSGTEVLFRLTDLQARMKETDWVITGEGALDKTSLQGKIPGEVAALAQKIGIPCIGVCGRFSENDRSLFAASGFSEILEIAPSDVSLAEKIRDASKWVKRTGVEIGHRILDR